MTFDSRDDQKGDGDGGEDDDPVGKSQAVASPRQLAGQEAVPGHKTGQERETVEAGIAARVEDEEGGQLHDVKQGVPDEGSSQKPPAPPGR